MNVRHGVEEHTFGNLFIVREFPTPEPASTGVVDENGDLFIPRGREGRNSKGRNVWQ